MYEREKQRELDIADAKRCVLGYLPTQEVMMWPKIREDCQNETGVNNNIVSIVLSELQEEGKIKRTRCSVDQWNNEHIFYVVQDSESSESGERQGNTEAGLTNKAPAEQSSDANSQPNSLSDEINQYKYKEKNTDNPVVISFIRITSGDFEGSMKIYNARDIEDCLETLCDMDNIEGSKYKAYLIQTDDMDGYSVIGCIECDSATSFCNAVIQVKQKIDKGEYILNNDKVEQEEHIVEEDGSTLLSETDPTHDEDGIMDICDMYITATILEMPSSVRIEDAMVYSNDDTYKICCMLDNDKEIIEMITCIYRTEESLDFVQCHNFDEFLDFVRTVRFDEDNDDNPSPQDDSSESSE